MSMHAYGRQHAQVCHTLTDHRGRLTWTEYFIYFYLFIFFGKRLAPKQILHTAERARRRFLWPQSERPPLT